MSSKKNNAVGDVNKNLLELQRKIDKLEADNARLKQRNEAVSGLKPIQDRILIEMNKLAKKSRVETGKIGVKIIDDHTNIALYHTNGHSIGKLVGPLHPHNAEVELKRFMRRGIILSVEKPTEAQIVEYKAGEEWQQLDKAFHVKRKRKIKTKRTGEIDKLAAAIEKLSGQKIVNTIVEVPVN